MREPNNFVNLTSLRFGMLKVIEYTDERKNGEVLWLCECDCGKQKLIRGHSLTSGQTVSCGCFRKQNSSMMIITGVSGRRKKFNYIKKQKEESCMKAETTRRTLGDLPVNPISETMRENSFLELDELERLALIGIATEKAFDPDFGNRTDLKVTFTSVEELLEWASQEAKEETL